MLRSQARVLSMTLLPESKRKGGACGICPVGARRLGHGVLGRGHAGRAARQEAQLPPVHSRSAHHRQGVTLVHSSAQLKPFMSLNWGEITECFPK
jgi:hypothetical protein